MKNFIKFIIFLPVIFISCETDIEEHKKNANNISITEKTLEQLKNNPKFNKIFKRLPKQNMGITEARSSIELQYNFTMDAVHAKVIETDSVTSFTLLIKRDTYNSNYFENLILQVNNFTDEQKAFIIKYTPTEIANAPNNSFTYKGYAQKTELALSGSKYSTQSQDICTIEVLMCNESWSGGVGSAHPAGSQCRNIAYMFVSRIKVLCGDGGGAPNGIPSTNPTDWGTVGNPYSSTDGHSSTTNPINAGSSESGNIITSPVIPTLDVYTNQIKSVNFYNSLTPLQKQWVDANSESFDSLVAYQIQDNWSIQSTLFASNLIAIASQNTALVKINTENTAQNSVSFGNLEQLDERVQNFNNALASNSIIEDNGNNSKTTRFTFDLDMFAYLNVSIKQNLKTSTQPYSVSSVTSSISGATLAMEWVQNTDDDLNVTNNIATVTFTGTMNLNCFIQGVGIFYSDNVTIIAKLNTLTGQLISGQLIGYD